MVALELPSSVAVQLHTLISLGLAILICGLAMWRGDQAARWFGATCLAAWVATLMVYQRDAHHADEGLLALDILTLIAFVFLSIRTRRIWTVIASAFQAIIVASHLAVMIDLRVTLGTMWISMALWSYGILACIAFGTWTARREGRDPEARA